MPCSPGARVRPTALARHAHQGSRLLGVGSRAHANRRQQPVRRGRRQGGAQLDHVGRARRGRGRLGNDDFGAQGILPAFPVTRAKRMPKTSRAPPITAKRSGGFSYQGTFLCTVRVTLIFFKPILLQAAAAFRGRPFPARASRPPGPDRGAAAQVLPHCSPSRIAGPPSRRGATQGSAALTLAVLVPYSVLLSHSGGPMVRSMTGFGRGERLESDPRVTVEIHSVNHRFLEVSTRLPRRLAALENKIRERLQGRVVRGKVHLAVTMDGDSVGTAALQVNEEVAQRYVEIFDRLRAALRPQGRARPADAAGPARCAHARGERAERGGGLGAARPAAASGARQLRRVAAARGRGARARPARAHRGAAGVHGSHRAAQPAGRRARARSAARAAGPDLAGCRVQSLPHGGGDGDLRRPHRRHRGVRAAALAPGRSSRPPSRTRSRRAGGSTSCCRR